MKKTLIIVLLVLTAGFVWARGSEENTSSQTQVPNLEIWDGAINSNGETPFDSPRVKVAIENTGVGYHMPEVPWNGGADYLEKLRLRIAGRELPDIFTPWLGIETELIADGALADLTDLLPKYAPNLWKAIPQDIWVRVKQASPDGKSIYYIPYISTAPRHGAFIRQDWLDRLGLDVPTTQQEYYDVLVAFRDKDADGDGDPDNEIPVSGREFGRWMDVLFMMFDVAMTEGYPDWDVYDGKIQYSAVTQNMKEAVAWIRKLYFEGLLDQETFLNKSNIWYGKIRQGSVGSWFHMPLFAATTFILPITKNNSDAVVSYLPCPKVPGYESTYDTKRFVDPRYVIATGDEETVINALKLIDWAGTHNGFESDKGGRIEDVDYIIEDGKTVKIESENAGPGFFPKTVETLEPVYHDMDMNRELWGENVVDQWVAILNSATETPIAADGMPASVYKDYPDIKSHQLYFEYLAKVVVGEWELSKWDEFIERWYETGGREVTERVQAWYAALSE